jgi:hypothetical protein
MTSIWLYRTEFQTESEFQITARAEDYRIAVFASLSFIGTRRRRVGTRGIDCATPSTIGRALPLSTIRRAALAVHIGAD